MDRKDQVMSKISLKFTNKDGKFCLCAHVRGTQVRHYKVVSVLKNPNFSKWNPQAQMFISKVENDLQNNIRLLDFLSPFEKLLAEQEFENGKELFATYEAGERERAEQPFSPRKANSTPRPNLWRNGRKSLNAATAIWTKLLPTPKPPMRR